MRTNISMAVDLLRQAADDFRRVGDAGSIHWMQRADIYEEMSVLLEKDPMGTGRIPPYGPAPVKPRGSKHSPYTPADRVRDGYMGGVKRKPRVDK
jgi:hypothetical protein